MLRGYPDLVAIYIGGSLGGAVLLSLALFGNGTTNDFVAFGSIFLWVLAVGILTTRLANRRANRLMMLRNNCRTREYLEAYAKLEQRGRSDRRYQNLVRINMSAGLLDAGEFTAARQRLDALNIRDGERPLDLTMRALRANHYASILTETGDYRGAEEALTDCERIVQDPRVQEPMRSQLIYYCKIARARLTMEVSGNYQSAYTTFRGFLHNASTLREKVAYSYRLAQICHHLGLTSEERSYVDFVARQGGDTIWAQRAREILGSLTAAAAASTSESVQ